MQISRDDKSFSFVLFAPDRAFLAQILSKIITNYSQKPGDMDPRVAAAWYPPGIGEKPEDAEDVDIWVEELRVFRSGNAGLCRTCLQFLQEAGAEEPVVLQIPLEQSETFMVVLNDHRIYQAALHGIGELEMDRPWDKVQDLEKRQALLEIHFLAVILETMLHLGTDRV